MNRKKKKPDCCDIAELLGAAKINFKIPENPTAMDDLMHYGSCAYKVDANGKRTRIHPMSIIFNENT